MRVLTVVLCIIMICSSTANIYFSVSNNEVIPDPVMTIADANELFIDEGSSDDMTISDASDEVFVAGGNIIYKLSANLSPLINVTVSNDAAVSVRGLSVSSNGGRYIVACLTTGSCIGYDVINLNSTSSLPLSEPTEVPLSDDDPVVMFPGAAEGIVYNGTTTDVEQTYRISLGRYRISSGSIIEVLHGSSRCRFNLNGFWSNQTRPDFFDFSAIFEVKGIGRSITKSAITIAI